MDRKINVFIGSSSESLAVADRIKEILEVESDIDCTIWKKGVFDYNTSFLTSLMEASYSFDFGIFIAAFDDKVTYRDDEFKKTRDNVIFEYGMFLGTLGHKRTLIIKDSDVELPTDLLGYHLPRFKESFDDSDWDTLLTEVKDYLRKEIKKSQIQILPSTALAIGYFKSFLGKVSKFIAESDLGDILNKNSVTHGKTKLRIVIPNTLSDNVGYKAKLYYQKNNFIPDEIGDPTRPFPIQFFKDTDELVIVDMPTTLNAIRPAVNMLVLDSGIGENNKKNRIERRELENFKRTLEYLVSQDDYARDVTEVIWQEDE